MTVRAYYGQSYYDVALEHTGLAANAAIIALANNELVSDPPEGDITIPDDIEMNYSVVEFFKKQPTKPATYENI